jgi:hypothetical protein
MTDQTYRTTWEARTPPFGIQDLLRLAIWGTFAAAALALAVISVSSGAGFRQASPPPEVLAQSAATAAETRRLAEAVRTLVADREQMLNRISALEHGLDDVTGSIKREARPAAPAARAEPAPPAETTANIGQAPPAAEPAQGNAVNPAEISPAAPAAGDIVTAALGVDVGGATSFEGLRTLWASTKHSLPPMPDELFPLVGLRENNKGSADLRLIVGPVANAEAIARLCGKLSAAHRYCQPATFQGQRLSLVEPAPKSTAAAPPSAILAAPQPPAPHHPVPGPRQP